MNLRDLEYLVALADEQHFGRAAARCGVSQPTLSTQLKKLEADLGVQLVERNSRGVMFTPAGREILARARTILTQAGEIRDIAVRHADPRTGVLRLGFFPTLGPYVLPHVLPRLRERLPGVETLLVEEKTDELLAQLRAGRLDAAALALPIEDPTLHVEPLFDEDFVLAVPTGHRLDQPGPIPASALAHERLLLLTEGHCLRDQALAVCDETNAEERDGFQATSLETLRHMVAAGVGITLLPQLSVHSPVPVSPDLALVRFQAPAPFRRIGLVWRRSSANREVLLEVAQVFRSLPPDLVRAIGRQSV